MGIVALKPAVFLDRDGVINLARSPFTGEPPRTLRDFVLIDGVHAAVRALKDAGHVLVVFTNQPDIDRGLMSDTVLDEMHALLRAELPVDDIRVCPHGGTEPCRCRKPAAGMILDAAADLDLDLAESWTVGDRWVDIAAGRTAGTRTILIESRESWRPTSTDSPPPDLHPDHVVRSLAEAAALITAADRVPLHDEDSTA